MKIVKAEADNDNDLVQAARTTDPIRVEDYLDGELSSEIRHEYIGGVVYTMAGDSREHNTICQNLLIALRAHLRGKGCRVFIEDVKLRMRINEEDVFYYPDLMVTCDPRDTNRYYMVFAKVLIEVQAPGTERIDRTEKFQSYTRIESLEEYVLVSQERMEATVYRRKNDWRGEAVKSKDGALVLTSLDFQMPLAAVYEDAMPAEA